MLERGCEEEEEAEGEEEFPMREGETPAERRKRIKAIKSGQALIILKSNPDRRFE